jgi:putative effector of murein hydrolase LrgA (UPF0299 family)
MNHKSWIKERQIMQLLNEPHVMNRRNKDNTMAKWTTSHARSWLEVHLAIVLSVFILFMTCGSFDHCIICLSSVHDFWFIWPLYYLSFFCGWLVVHLAIVLSLFLLFMTCGSFSNCIICQAMHKRKTDNTMVKWTTRHEQKKDR